MKCRTLSLCLYVGMLYCEGENPASAATRQMPTKAPANGFRIRIFGVRIAVAAECLSLQKSKHEGFIERSESCYGVRNCSGD